MGYKRVTEEIFMKRAKEKHGDFYDYSQVEYKNTITKIKIICPIHGPFYQIPEKHMKGQGCTHCGRERTIAAGRSNTIEFINKSKIIHGDKYDYSKVDYKNNITKVALICPIHGEFLMTPSDHLSGYGCRKCGTLISSQKNTLPVEEYIRRFKERWGEQLDFTNLDYKEYKKETILTCKKHGPFLKTPEQSVFYGCPFCSGKYLNTQLFIERSIKKHGDFYDYTRVKFINSDTPVEIICPIHGAFWQKPTHHLEGSGCRLCREPRGERKIRLFLQNAHIIHEPQKTFPDLIYNHHLYYDFYVEHDARKILIEFNGEQHYRFIKQFHCDEKGFETQRNRDSFKIKYAYDNGYELLIIPYTDIEDIDIILTNYLNLYACL